MSEIVLQPARSERDLAEVHAWFLEYAKSLDFELCFQGFDEELASLPGCYAPPAGELLIVRRPPDDADLPDIWGLPAATLSPEETWSDGVRRAGRQKLGVDLRPVGVVGEGTARRDEYTLQMRLYEAARVAGEPKVPQPHREVTQYTAWRWGSVADLMQGARQGSLCCRLMLESVGAEWREPRR